MSSVGGQHDAKQRAAILGQARALLTHRRGSAVAALLLLSGGYYTYYLRSLSARQQRRIEK